MRQCSRVFMGARCLAMCVVIFLGASAPANANGVFFSEYVEGTSNNKALELFNATGSAIDLAAGGYAVEIYFNGSGAAGQTIGLTGVIPSLGTYVLAHTAASIEILTAADQVSGSVTFNGNDAVALVSTGPVTHDVIGQIAFNPGTEWGAGLQSTQDNTLRRNTDICDGDPDGSNAFDPTVEWSGFVVNTTDGLGAHVGNCVVIAVEEATWEGVKRLYR